MLILTVIFVLYFVFLVAMLVGWNRSSGTTPVNSGGKEPLMSVIVPVRNEENTIPALLRSLAVQDYTNFEVIVVNDDSEDETLWMVSQSGMPNIRIVHSSGKGKKAAITAGVRAARGAIVVTTDADCIVNPGWLSRMREPFRDPEVMMAFGGVRMVGDNSFFAMLQGIEFASLIGVGASTATIGFPTMCNGANLAYRKKVFSEVKGYDGNLSVSSGDDEFLMRKVEDRYPGSTRFVFSPEAVATTGAQPDFPSFINQRIRWASKWKHNHSIYARTMAVMVLVFQAAFVANWFYLFSPQILQAFFLMTLKMLLEAAFLLQVCRFLGTTWTWPAFFALQVLYPFYVIATGLMSFFRPYEWKHRIFRPQ